VVRAARKTSSSKKIIRRISRAISASNRLFYYPLVAKEAHGCNIVDVDGKSYLDFNASWTVAGVGYSNPEVVKAIEEELKRSAGVATVTFPSETTVKFAERLIRIAPGNFGKKVWFGHSAGDACAAAYKMFPQVTKKPRVISFYGGMHGVDLAGLAMGGHPATGKFAVPNMVTKVPYAYCYRSPFGLEYPSCDIYCASDFIEEQVFKYVNPPEDTSFMIVEPMQSDSGDVIPPKGYLKKLKTTCDKFGILFVSDEVKSGFGRTGKMFGVEHSPSVTPDGIALGKSMASGMPIGALVAKRELLDNGFLLSTLAGNAISAAAGLATLDLVERMKLPENAARIGMYMKKRLDELKEKYELIGDVRGEGLLMGLELVKDRKTKEPAKLEAAKVVYRAWQLGLLLAFLGVNSNVIEVTPPLTITNEEANKGLETLEGAIKDVQAGLVSDSAVKSYTGF
jgi:4-aminobutyrate aminotransferase